jgi:hypothetical protein
MLIHFWMTHVQYTIVMWFLCPPSKKRGYIALHMSVCPLVDQSLSEWYLNNALTYGPQILHGHYVWPVDDPYWFWGQQVNVTDLEHENLVQVITWQCLDPMSSNFTWVLGMPYWRPLLILRSNVKVTVTLNMKSLSEWWLDNALTQCLQI